MGIDKLSELPRLLRVALPDARIRQAALEDPSGRSSGIFARPVTSGPDSIPAAVFSLMEWDDDPDVCFAAVVASPFDSKDGFRRLAADPRLAAHETWIQNARLLEEATARELPLWADEQFRAAIADDARSPDLHRMLGRDASTIVRRSLAGNDNCVDSVLTTLTCDRAPDVAEAAIENQRHRQERWRASAESRDDGSRRARVGQAMTDLRASTGEIDMVLARLAHLSAPVVESRLLRQSWVPAEVLRDLVTHRLSQFERVIEAVAGNINTPPETLESLAHGTFAHRDAQIAALANPSLGPESLVRIASGSLYGVQIGEQELEAIWSNPSLPETLVLSKPTSHGARSGLARNPSAPDFVLARLARDDELCVRRGVAANKATPVETLVELAQSALNDLRYHIAPALALNPNTPREAIAKLAGHPELREVVARAPLTPPEILHELSTDDDVEVRLGVAFNPSTRPSTLATLAGDEGLRERSSTWEYHRGEAIARLQDDESDSRTLPRPTTLDEAAAMFVRALDRRLREDLALHSSPFWMAEAEFIQSVFVNDPISKIRKDAAFGGDDVLRRQLARDVVDDVVSSVAWRTTDPSLSELLVAREAAQLGLTFNPVTPAHVLLEVARSSPGKFQDPLARHPHATSELLAALVATPASEPAPTVPVLVAQHPAVDVATLTTLSHDDSAAARQNVAAHQNTPPEVLTALAGDDDPVTRLVVAMNRHTPPEVADRLAADPDVRVRRAVAVLPGISVAVWMRLVVDDDAAVRFVAQRFSAPALGVLSSIARDAPTDPALLDALASDRRLAVRTAVAENSAATPAALDLLAGDEEPAVRLLVARRFDVTDCALQLLVNDPVWSVRRAAKSTRRRRRTRR